MSATPSPPATTLRGRIAQTRLLPDLGAILLYFCLCIIVTWPLVLHPITSVAALSLPGDPNVGVDAYQHIWHHWWVTEALSHGQNPFFTNLLYYPEGIDLFWQTLGFTQGLVALPITLTLGPVAGANFTIVCSFVIGGYATFVLARRLTGSLAGALVAGAIYAFSPYHLQKVLEGSYELAAIQWLPLYVLALDSLLERPKWWRGLLAGGLLLWVSLGAWYYGLFAVLFTGCAIGVRALRTWMANTAEWRMRLRAVVQIGLWGLVPLLIWGIVLGPKIATVNQSVDQASWDLRGAQVEHAADLIDFFLPSPLSPFWGDNVRTWRTALFDTPITFWNVSLGLVGLPLALIGLLAAWRRSWRWGALLLAMLLLGLGPQLRVFGFQTSIPLPFALIRDLPGIRTSHRPGHLTVLAVLMVAILAAEGVRRLVEARSQVVTQAAAVILALGVVVVDGSVATPLLTIYNRTIPAFYTTLPAPDGALLALPMYVNINRIEHMYNQTAHRWPIFAGYVARPPAYRFAYETEGINQIREGRADPNDIVSPGWPESGQRALAALKIRYLTMDLTTARGDGKLAAGKPEYFAAVRQLLKEMGVGAPIAQDADLEAYAIPSDWPIGPIGSLGQGWRALEQQPGTSFRWRWMGPRASIRLLNPTNQPVVATIRLNLASYQHPRSMALTLDDKPLGQVDVQPNPTAHTIIITLPPGTHILALAADADPDPGAGGLPTSIRAFGVGFSFGKPIP